MKTTVLLTFLSLGSALLQAQSPTDPLSGGIKGVYNISRSDVLRAAEKMPEENYSFKPTPDVRSFGQIVGHIADAQYLFCSVTLGDTNPAPGIEKSKTSKADLVKALSDALTYCDKAYSAMTDAHAADMVKFFGRDQPKLAILAFNSAHNMEHYGNLVTYMRIKGLVPPSSEQRK
jgi:uncharacterized damage-inducible protein DinB